LDHKAHTHNQEIDTQSIKTSTMSVEELQAQIDRYQTKINEYAEAGKDDAADRYGVEMQRLQRKLAKEEAKVPIHPA
jgi:hypothetical protein